MALSMALSPEPGWSWGDVRVVIGPNDTLWDTVGRSLLLLYKIN